MTLFKTAAAEQRIPNGATAHPPIVAIASHVNATEPSRTLPAGDVFKARLILALADGHSCGARRADWQSSGQKREMRIPGQADQRSGMMPITIPGLCRSGFRD